MEQKTNNSTTFEQVKRGYETALASGKDSTTELIALATAVAYSVINKCLDPQRKTAVDRDTVSNNGYNPTMLAVKQGIAHDIATLANTRRNADTATRITYNADGDLITATVDKTAETALASLISETLTDGIDLVQTAALAILEQAAEHAAEPGWLDRPYTVRRLSRRVYIRAADSAAYRDGETTPIQEIYRAVRRYVQGSRAVQTDPQNGYLYIEDLTADGLETIYRRLGKYADLGGYANNGRDCDRLPGSPAGYTGGDSHYTADRQTADDYDTIIAKLNLTDRQAVIVRLRMQGRGYKQIATYLGVTHNAILNALKKVQVKAEKIGLTPKKVQVKAKKSD